jgi:hypothetical protein
MSTFVRPTILPAFSFAIAAGLFTLLIACSEKNNSPAATDVPTQVTSEESISYEEGTPGSVRQNITTITAAVQSIDYEKRTLTVTDTDGKQLTIIAPPDAVTFQEIRQGDQVNIEYVEQVVISMPDPALATPVEDSAETKVDHAPDGDKPALEVQSSQVITAKVTAIDEKNHVAKLQFSDGSSRMVNVRPDVKLKREFLARDVVFETSQYLLMKVEKAQR